MNDELAKQLKEAGFPHEGSWYSYDGNSYSGKRMIYTPTLSELIEACGRGFRSLSFHSLPPNGNTSHQWIAKAGAGFGKFLKNGHTPSEAVARLWLALNKK